MLSRVYGVYRAQSIAKSPHLDRWWSQSDCQATGHYSQICHKTLGLGRFSNQNFSTNACIYGELQLQLEIRHMSGFVLQDQPSTLLQKSSGRTIACLQICGQQASLLISSSQAGCLSVVRMAKKSVHAIWRLHSLTARYGTALYAGLLRSVCLLTARVALMRGWFLLPAYTPSTAFK